MTAIPGLRGIEHIGFTVPNLDQAHQFLTEVLGCTYIYSLGPIGGPGDWMERHLGVPRQAHIRELRFYRCATGANLEVFEYAEVPAQRPQPRNCDIGGHHLAFYVDDMDGAVAYLREQGVEVFAGPNDSTGPSAGQQWVYFLTPWGMQMELVSFPEGKAYEASATTVLWHPAAPSQ